VSLLVPVVSAPKRVTLLLSAQTSLRRFARIVAKKVRHHPQSLVPVLRLILRGHRVLDCQNNRTRDDLIRIKDVSGEEAWNKLCKASEEKDLDDFRIVWAQVFLISISS
jgi:hypothetical protein